MRCGKTRNHWENNTNSLNQQVSSLRPSSFSTKQWLYYKHVSNVFDFGISYESYVKYIADIDIEV